MTDFRPRARRFELLRHQDVSGVSGVGVVAEGVQFTDGTVALRWVGRNPTSVVFHDRGIESVRAVHGHDGATEIVFLDEPGPIEFDHDLPWRVRTFGTVWERCPGCDQPNHSEGGPKWREVGGGVHSDGASIRRWLGQPDTEAIDPG